MLERLGNGLSTPGSSNGPLVTVVIPAYNAEAWLMDAIHSVIRQTYRSWELVVVDDGSTDGTADLVASYARRNELNIRLESVSHKGVSAARNAGARLAGGTFLAFLDADDVWHPRKLDTQIEYLQKNPHHDGVGCVFESVSCDLSRTLRLFKVSWSEEAIKSWLLLENTGVLLPSTLVLKSSTFRSLGGFNEDLSTAADLDLAWRLVQAARIGAVEETLVKYRICPGQMHTNMSLLERDYSYLIRLHPEVFDQQTRTRVNFNLQLLEIARMTNNSPSLKHFAVLFRMLLKNPRQFTRWLASRISRRY